MTEFKEVILCYSCRKYYRPENMVARKVTVPETMQSPGDDYYREWNVGDFSKPRWQLISLCSACDPHYGGVA